MSDWSSKYIDNIGHSNSGRITIHQQTDFVKETWNILLILKLKFSIQNENFKIFRPI